MLESSRRQCRKQAIEGRSCAGEQAVTIAEQHGIQIRKVDGYLRFGLAAVDPVGVERNALSTRILVKSRA